MLVLHPPPVCDMMTAVRSGSKSPDWKGADDLPQRNDGRIAGIVIYVPKTQIHRIFIDRGQDDRVITAFPESRLQEIELHRRHLRDNNSIIFRHLFRKDDTLKIIDFTFMFDFVLFSLVDGRFQRADTDARRPQIRAFVDLQNGI